MKKNIIAKVSVLLASIMLVCVSLAGCGGLFGGGGDNSAPTPKDYTIQYSDDAGTHTLTVTEGMPYSLENVPYKYGYEFLGLYDAQTGGTQYVGANGASLAPYKDQENKVLFPQFKPIDYTVILDYGNANVTGERSITVAYNSNLPELPKNLTLAHNEFTGWYTETGGKGTQVADAYGNLPVVSVLNEENFKLDESKRVYLYAGFELETYTVTFIFDNDMPSEEVEVPYNTPISQVVPKTRNDKKEAGLTWSKSEDGEVFNGNITDDIILYVQEWAPVIELNGNGAEVTPIVAKAGTTISLPAPTKPLAKFLRWEDENGQIKDITTMPTESTTLNAVWQAKIEFDENGGTDVDDISKPAGESISLPTPTKEGYLFAGWYTADKEQYTQTKMPSAGIALKAGWYKAKEKTIVVIENDISKKVEDGSMDGTHSLKENQRKAIDLSEILEEIPSNGVLISYQLKFRWGNTYQHYSATAQVALYDGKSFSSAYEICKKSLSHGNGEESYCSDSISGEAIIHNNVLYFYYSGAGKGKITLSGGYGYNVAFYDVTFELTYPDITYLYL